MELSSRKTSKRAIEPVDEWLQNEGYYRKHAPKDPTCLFRAVSEQVYQNQRCHIRVRKECVDFMRKNKKMFEEKISTPFDNYLEQMACFTEWGGMNEILTMSMLYKRNVVLFHGQKLTRETVIDHGYNDNLFLCFTPPKQYETVYSQEYTGVAGFCQSIVYQTLYKNVFKMNNVDATVHKMLHERNNHLRHDKFFLKGNLEIRNQLTLELLDKIEDTGNSEELQLLTKGITPFPYRVAKALDPNIYRNVDYDIWHEIRREVRNSGYTKFNSTELQAGAKCLVQIDLKEHDKVNNNFLTTKESWDNNSKAVTKPKRLDYTGHIQEMSKNEGPVVVFIEDLGEMMTVPYESLKPYPQKKVKQNNWSITANKKNVIAQNPKGRKPWNSTGRKIKDQISNENNIDKNQVNNSKAISKNTVNKVEWNNATHIDNHPGKLQPENYTYKDFTANTEVDNVRAALESTHLSPVDAGDQTCVDKNSKSPSSTEVVDNAPKKQVLTNYNHETNQPNKQHNQRAEKNEIFYLPYSAAAYPPNPRYPGDGDVINYDMVKNLDVESTDIPYSDPATVRHFFNLGVKYFWTQNMWANGINGQPFGDNSYYVNQPPPDLNVNMINSPVPNGENVHQSNNTGGNIRHINRSSPVRQKDQENIISHTHNPKLGGQKPNFRGSELRNPNSQRDSHQSNVDVNKNRMDYKNPNEHQQGTSNKESQRGNKSNGVAPRFKKNYEGRNRNDHHNNQHYRQQQQQHQQDYEARAKKQVDAHTMANQGDMGDMSHLQQQQQQQQSHPGSLQHQQQPQPHQQQQQPPLMQAQTPSLNGSYPYPVPYNQQMPYIPLSPYPPESEGFPGPYYPPPPSFIQVPYLPPTELPEGANLGAPPCVSPVYTGLENFPAQYPPVYSQYIYPPPTMYQTNQPPGNGGAATAAPMQENCYPGPYQSQPYFIQYPPPIPPVNSQPAPTH